MNYSPYNHKDCVIFITVTDNGGWCWSRLYVGNRVWEDLVRLHIAYCCHIIV